MIISKARVRNTLSSRQHHLNMYSAFHCGAFEIQYKFGWTTLISGWLCASEIWTWGCLRIVAFCFWYYLHMLLLWPWPSHIVQYINEDICSVILKNNCWMIRHWTQKFHKTQFQVFFFSFSFYGYPLISELLPMRPLKELRSIGKNAFFIYLKTNGIPLELHEVEMW